MLSAPLRETLAKFRSSAGDGTRTRTPDYQAADFKSAASAIPPLRLFQQSTKSRPSWQCLAACFALDVGCLVSPYAGLPSSVRLCFGQPCSPFEAGALPVLRPARRIHIRLQGRVLCNPPRLKGFRPAAAQNKAAQCILGNWANGACVRHSLRGKARLLPRAASTVRSAILRRRNTASLSRLRPVAHHANRSLAVPLRLLLARVALPRPSAMARFSS